MNKLLLFIALASLAVSSTVTAAVRLPHLISDGMVVQYDKPLRLWGWADPGEKVQIFLDHQSSPTAVTTADSLGNWHLEIPPLPLGAKHSLKINNLQINDIAVGWVLLCSGQSNMELPVSRIMERWGPDIRGYVNPDIREYSVPKEISFHGPVPDTSTPARWLDVNGSNEQRFSALGYYTARALHQATGLPVGIVNASWGGTPIESWMSRQMLAPFPYYLHQYDIFASDSLRHQITLSEKAQTQAWNAILDVSDPGLSSPVKFYSDSLDTSSWQLVDIFSDSWASDGQSPYTGSHWFRNSFSANPAQAQHPALLRLGAMVYADSVWVNGHLVGVTYYQYPPRIYTVPAHILRPGENSITIRLISQNGNPRFVPEKPYSLTFADSVSIPLDSKWLHTPGSLMPPSPPVSFFCYLPQACFDGMAAPVLPYNYGAVVWYQGESNVDRSLQYLPLLSAMVQGWRHQNASPNLPFYIIELADFLPPAQRSKWHQMQQLQAKAPSLIPNAFLVPNADLGEWNDIHPTDKKSLGQRVATQILMHK